jgi:DNA-binding beta-propeller fold protein YncE
LNNERTAKQSEDLLMKSTRNEKVSFAVARVKAMGLRWGSVCRWVAVAAALVLLATGVSFASFSLTFQGLVRTLNTGGSITLSSPAGTVVDGAGDVFVVDTGNNRIVEVNAQGTASVLTITGLSPSLSSPSGVAIDGAGNLYIADTGNSRVVKIATAGAGSVVTTGSVTLSSPRGVALDQSGDIFVADTGNNRIVEVTSGGTASALPITVSSGTSTLSSPKGLGVNTSGKLYIADSGNNRIVTVASGSTTGVVQSILGGVTLSNPTAVVTDRIGNVYIADTGNDRIAEIDTSNNGTVLYTASTTLNGPLGVAVDSLGTVYVADTGDSQAYVVNPLVNADLVPGDQTYSLNKSVVEFGHVQLGSTTAVTLTLPFTTDFSSGLGGVKVFTQGTQSLDFTSGSGTTCNSSTGASTSCSVQVNFLPTKAGLRNGAVVLYDTSLNPILTLPLYGWGDAPLAALSPNTGSVISTGSLVTSNPYQVALDGAGNIYIGDYTGKNVTKIPTGGGAASLVSLGTPGSIALQNITGVAIDGAGNLYIGDHQNNRILVMTPGGVVSVLSITGLSPALGFPTALNFDSAGNLYIADFTNGRIVEVSTLVVAGSTSSGLGTVIGTGSYTFTGSTVTGMTIDSQGNIYVAARTQNSSSIIKVTAAGVGSEVAIPNNITPAISNPQGVAVDAFGNLYIVDTANTRIVKITNAGVASVLSISGLTSPATLSTLVFGVTVDSAGNVYIPDWTNNRIVFVNVSGAALTFASTNRGSTSSDSPKAATVTNLGNQPLVFSANPTYTANFSSNTSDTNLCTSTTSLAAGTACDVGLKFTPQAAGSLSANVTVTDNNLNVASSTQQVSASGTGLSSADSTALAVTATPTVTSTGSAVSLTATVTDTATGNTATIPTGGVTFTDTVGGSTTSLNSGNAVTLNGTGKAVLAGVTFSTAGTHTITATYPGVSGVFATSTNTTTVTVTTQIVPTINWTPATAIFAGASLSSVLNATATSNGTAVPGTFAYTATLQGGSPVAITSASTLTGGSYTLEATFTPTNTTTYHSATASVSIKVQDFTLAVATTAGATSSATVAPGGVATYALAFGPSGGTTFPSAVTLTVSGLPAGDTATITPSTIPAGSGPTNVTLAIQTATTVASAFGNRDSLDRALSPALFSAVLLPFAGFLPWRKSLRRGRTSRASAFLGVMLLVLACCATIGGLSGCGSKNSGYLGARSQTTMVTVTATSGNLSHSTTVSLTVNN